LLENFNDKKSFTFMKISKNSNIDLKLKVAQITFLKNFTSKFN